MLFKLSNLNSNLALTLGNLNPALNNSALIVCVEREICFNHLKHYPDLDSDMLSVWNYCARFLGDISREISDGHAKCRLFSQARHHPETSVTFS